MKKRALPRAHATFVQLPAQEAIPAMRFVRWLARGVKLAQGRKQIAGVSAESAVRGGLVWVQIEGPTLLVREGGVAVEEG